MWTGIKVDFCPDLAAVVQDYEGARDNSRKKAAPASLGEALRAGHKKHKKIERTEFEVSRLSAQGSS